MTDQHEQKEAISLEEEQRRSAARARILDVIEDLRAAGRAVTLESIIEADCVEREKYNERRNWGREWEMPDLGYCRSDIEDILPTLLDLTGCRTTNARIKGWLSLRDGIAIKGGITCDFMGIDAGRAVWRWHKCGKTAVFLATEGVIHFVGMTPRDRISTSWIGVCEDHVSECDFRDHIAAFHDDDHKREDSSNG